MIDAYKRLYKKHELEQALRVALNDRASGVLVTQVNFQDGGGSGVPIQGDPNEIIEILELALKEIDSGQEAQTPLASGFNFSCRRMET